MFRAVLTRRAIGALLALTAAVAVAAATVPAPARAAGLTVENAWARASLGTAGASAAYLTIRNPGTAPDRLVSATAPLARRVELHTHIMEAGTARMREVAAIEIPAGGIAVLAPHGPHIMLTGLRRKLVVGERFPLTLTFARAGAITVEIAIRPLGARGHEGHEGYREQHRD